jgi:hypothetical protein
MSDQRLNNAPTKGGVQNAFIQGRGIISSSEENESIVITDIIARSSGELREDTALGDIIITIPTSGHSNLTTPIKVSKGASVYNHAIELGVGQEQNQVSINYYKTTH